MLVPRPGHTLLETLTPVSGEAIEVDKNAAGKPIMIFAKQYDHGLGAKGGGSVTYEIPAGSNAFKAVVALDDAQPESATARFTLALDDGEVWRSGPLMKRQSEMAHVALPGRGQLTLARRGRR